MDQREENEGGLWNMLVGDDKNFQDSSGEEFERQQAMRRQVLEQIQQQEAELAQLLPLAHQLRMQRHQLHETYCEKIEELETRILRAHVVPFDDGFISHLQQHAPKPSTRTAPPPPIPVAAQQPEEDPAAIHLLNHPSLPAWLPEVLAHDQHRLKDDKWIQLPAGAQLTPDQQLLQREDGKYLIPGERVIGYRCVDNKPDEEMGLFGVHTEEAAVSNTVSYDNDRGPRAWPGAAEVTYIDKDEFGNVVPNAIWYTDASTIPPCPPVKTLPTRLLDRIGKPGYNLYKYTH